MSRRAERRGRRVLGESTLMALLAAAVSVTTLTVSSVAAPPAAASHGCPAGTIARPLSWGAGGTVQWPVDSSSVFVDNWASSGVDLTISLSDPANRNGDSDNTLGVHEPGGSQPIFGWDELPPTQTDGVFGAGFLTVAMNTLYVGESLTFAFEFSAPVLVPHFSVGDIDYIGLGLRPSEEPHESFQDEVGFTASRGGVSVPIAVTPQGFGRPVLDGQTVRGGPYRLATNGDLQPTDANGTVEMSTSEPIDNFTFVYSNGPDDETAEAGPSYPPAAAAPGGCELGLQQPPHPRQLLHGVCRFGEHRRPGVE